MNALKSLLVGLAFSCLGVIHANAAPPEAELNQYLAEIGWTRVELNDYLDYYEIPIEDFATVEELKTVLGTPINSTNLQDLLTRYDLTEQQLHDLLDHFGDELSAYKFIEDLDASVDFYVNHDSYMADVEKDLEKMGITEAETEKLFTYLASVEEKYVSQLDEVSGIDSRLEKLLSVEDSSDLSEEELDELVDVLTETIAMYEIDVKFQLRGKNLSLKQLLSLKEVNGDLAVAVYSKAGDLLMDNRVPEGYFESLALLDKGEDMIHVGELSNEWVDHLHDEKAEFAERNMK